MSISFDDLLSVLIGVAIAVVPYLLYRIFLVLLPQNLQEDLRKDTLISLIHTGMKRGRILRADGSILWLRIKEDTVYVGIYDSHGSTSHGFRPYYRTRWFLKDDFASLVFAGKSNSLWEDLNELLASGYTTHNAESYLLSGICWSLY